MQRAADRAGAAFRIQRPGGGARLRRPHMQPGLHPAIHRGDAREAAFHQRLGRQRAGGHGGGEVADAARVPDQVIHVVLPLWHCVGRRRGGPAAGRCQPLTGRMVAAAILALRCPRRR